ncbi:LytTR family transcriptional regulator DNA-binding domain-containing protein [uncultured Chitinophaga sp.]|jgi:Response regulator of the LytR/AlgR family|uniref:LytR/AlgR family response regulator transcription factor n=1 Tax=uncultured Chitinophaga sp. TaxID=339340 RepID=UPI0026238AB9|nr:LytTR family transcriptional regulator DNA-binding domain-containing protein [uncultured Chitinophaga sp.]
MPEKFLIPHRDRIYVVGYSSILFFKSDDCYSHIHLNDGREFVLTTSLAKLQKEINHRRFIRISQSFLVNGDFITSIDKKKKFLLIGDNHHLPFTIPIKKLMELMVT